MIAFAVVVAISLVVLFTPSGAVPVAADGGDKVGHALLFASLAVTGRLAGIRARWLAPALAGYAAGSELIQALPLLNRDASVWDSVADVTGAAIGLLAVGWLLARRR